ncbi:MAG: hypothetical protein IKY87_06565 [Paludibacteraceae bacterium]|nr:hypothetical protein [Paludibacteraceae bacterium]
MKHLAFVIVLVGFLSACENVNKQSSIPNTPVNYTIHITREYPHFVIANGFQTMVVTEKQFMEEYIGYAGLLIWIGMDNAYHAADLCCPYCVKRNKPLTIDGIFAICELCGEQYDISFGIGNPTTGVTKEPLKRYNTSYRNMATGAQLYIFN